MSQGACTVFVDLGLSDAFGAGGRKTLLQALRGEYEGLTEDQQRSFEQVSEVQRLMICDLVENMEWIEARIKRYDASIARLVELLSTTQNDDVRLLVTIPGMALSSAAVVKAELDGVDRSANPERLCAYFGLAPRVYQSGPVTRTGRIVKTSNKHVRTTMYLVAQKCAQIGPRELQEFHERIKKKRGHHVATIALARRLMVVIWKMLKERVPFRTAYNRGLARRKEARYKREVKRLKKIRSEYGVEEFLKMVNRVMMRSEDVTMAPYR